MNSRPADYIIKFSKGSKGVGDTPLEMPQQLRALEARQWYCTPLIQALRRQRQADLSKLEASLVYRVSSSSVMTVTQRNHVSKNYIHTK